MNHKIVFYSNKQITDKLKNNFLWLYYEYDHVILFKNKQADWCTGVFQLIEQFWFSLKWIK